MQNRQRMGFAQVNVSWFFPIVAENTKVEIRNLNFKLHFSFFLHTWFLQTHKNLDLKCHVLGPLSTMHNVRIFQNAMLIFQRSQISKISKTPCLQFRNSENATFCLFSHPTSLFSPTTLFWLLQSQKVCFENIQLSFRILLTNHQISRNGQTNSKMLKKSVKMDLSLSSNDSNREKIEFPTLCCQNY